MSFLLATPSILQKISADDSDERRCMISLDEARQIILESLLVLHAESSSLNRVLGRVLRETITAPEDFPAFDRSAMDGYAIAMEDRSERFQVIGEVQAGQVPDVAIGRGQCVRIFTGGQIPNGASQVLMQEDVRRDEDWMIPQRRSSERYIRRRGEDMQRGAVLLEPGARLGPGECALLAQIGVTLPKVSAKPRVIHIATGGELVPPSQEPGPGQIRDSNSTLISGLLAQCGALLVKQDRCGDDLQTLVERVRREPTDSWDLLLISGGASVGDYDFGKRALAELGFEIRFQQINLRPGKPLVFAVRDRQAAFVIPGNPVSHFVVFHLAIRMALERLEGARLDWSPVTLPIATAIEESNGPRETYWPARLVNDNGRLAVLPIAWQSSGDLRGLTGVEGLIRIAPKREKIAVGETVEFLKI